MVKHAIMKPNRLNLMKIIATPFLALALLFGAGHNALAESFLYQCNLGDESELSIEVVFPKHGHDEISIGTHLNNMKKWNLNESTLTEINQETFYCYESKSSKLFPSQTEQFCLSHDFLNGLPAGILHYSKSERNGVSLEETARTHYRCKNLNPRQ